MHHELAVAPTCNMCWQWHQPSVVISCMKWCEIDTVKIASSENFLSRTTIIFFQLSSSFDNIKYGKSWDLGRFFQKTSFKRKAFYININLEAAKPRQSARRGPRMNSSLHQMAMARAARRSASGTWICSEAGIPRAMTTVLKCIGNFFWVREV